MNRFFSVFLLLFTCVISSCRHIVINEGIVDIPEHEWKKNVPAAIELEVTDTATYQLYLIVRHTQQYPYNNIIVNVAIADTSNRPLASFKVNASLVSNSGRWAGNNIDDLYDHRIRLNTTVALKKNRYRFIIRQLMKEDPLPFVLNAGIAIEKTSATRQL